MRDDLEKRYFVEAAAKALDVLESFDTFEEELTVLEVARRARVSYSSAFRLLYTLEKRGFVTRHPGAKKFSRTPVRKRFRIGYAALDNSMKFCAQVSHSIAVAARTRDVALIVRDNEMNAPKTLANVDALMEEGIHLLIEYQTNEAVAHLIATKCHEAHVPVIAVNFSIPGSYYFGGNNYLAGMLAGKFLSGCANGGPKRAVNKMLILPASGMGSTQEARVAGVRNAFLQNLPHLSEHDIRTAPPGLTRHDGYRATKELLRSIRSPFKKILIAAMTDPLGIGASRAIADLGITNKTCIVGQGGGEDALRYLRKARSFMATVTYFPGTYGERVIPLALKILAGEKVPLTCWTDHVVLTATNLHEYFPTRPTRV